LISRRAPGIRDLVAAVRYGSLTGASVSFVPVEREPVRGGERIVQAHLREISITGTPFYKNTAVWVLDDEPHLAPSAAGLVAAP
jgi:phage head maturation protease